MKTVITAALSAALLGLVVHAPQAVAADSSTTRIIHSEPYGAIVTRESGVLVFRALPPTTRVIVNPGGKTPVTVNQTEVRETNTYVVPQALIQKPKSWSSKIIRRCAPGYAC